ncbi:MAG TPA: acyl-CoA dehydrogenase family protein, partial [Longimicrobiales bacterium]|nr:acyl-CoA dehydrogenase family protein [Longimicrobiales bacterium]
MTGPAEIGEIRALARDFAASALRPDVERWDAAGALDDAVVPRLAELGFLGMLVPEAHGGMGFDATAYAAAVEELAWGEPGVALLVAQSTIAADLIARRGSDDLRAAWLPDLAAGVKTACLAFSDPDGPDSARDATRAERVTGAWRLHGCKRWVTNGARADVAVVLAAT